MSLAIFAFGAVSFLIAVRRTVVVGGKVRTGRRLGEQLGLKPEAPPPQTANVGIDRARALVRSEL